MSRSKHKRTVGDTVDLSLLTDGLEAEREQGITIDVAYRYFATPKRKFIIADTPGHEQYTRNMVTGASTADAVIILVDVSKVKLREDGGVDLLIQTKRHSTIAHLLQIEHVIVAVNKMDLVELRPGGVRPHRQGLPGIRRDAGPEGHHADSAVGPDRRQRGRAQRQHGLVRRPDR